MKDIDIDIVREVVALLKSPTIADAGICVSILNQSITMQVIIFLFIARHAFLTHIFLEYFSMA